MTFAIQPTSPPGQESLPLAVALAVAVLPLPQSQPPGVQKGKKAPKSVAARH